MGVPGGRRPTRAVGPPTLVGFARTREPGLAPAARGSGTAGRRGTRHPPNPRHRTDRPGTSRASCRRAPARVPATCRRERRALQPWCRVRGGRPGRPTCPSCRREQERRHGAPRRIRASRGCPRPPWTRGRAGPRSRRLLARGVDRCRACARSCPRTQHRWAAPAPTDLPPYPLWVGASRERAGPDVWRPGPPGGGIADPPGGPGPPRPGVPRPAQRPQRAGRIVPTHSPRSMTDPSGPGAVPRSVTV